MAEEAAKSTVKVRQATKNLQNKSPISPSWSFDSPFAASNVHSQSGYSWSSNATGSGAPLTKFSPFSGVPAGTELIIAAVVAFFFESFPPGAGVAASPSNDFACAAAVVGEAAE